MNRDRAIKARRHIRVATRQMCRGNTQSAAENVNDAKVYLDRVVKNAVRKPNKRKAKRALRLLDKVELPVSPRDLPVLPDGKMDFLKLGLEDGHGHPSKWGGRYNTTLAYPWMPSGDREVMRTLYLERGYDTMPIYARAGGNLEGLFNLNPKVYGRNKADFYKNPSALVPIIKELRADGIRELIVLMDNEDIAWNRRDWQNQVLPDLTRGLKVWHDELETPAVCLGIEIDKSWNTDWVHPEQLDIGWKLVNDAIGKPHQNPAKHLAPRFPDLDVWVHFANIWNDKHGNASGQRDQYAFVPNAKGILYQYPWDSFKWNKAEIRQWTRKIDNWADRDNWLWHPFEYSQHFRASEERAVQQGSWIVDTLGRPVYGTGGRD